MPSFQDSAVLVLLALLLFGPKGLAKLARQLGRLMGEFRRASNEFRMQMEDEFRLEEQAEQQKKIAAMEAAAPVSPAFNPDARPSEIPEPEHPHMPPPAPLQTEYSAPPEAAQAATPLPIASAGDLHLMPPATGLPEPRSSSLAGLLEAVPRIADPNTAANPAHVVTPEHENSIHG
jgi:sec-independent protein translocase protein TatB